MKVEYNDIRLFLSIEELSHIKGLAHIASELVNLSRRSQEVHALLVRNTPVTSLKDLKPFEAFLEELLSL